MPQRKAMAIRQRLRLRDGAVERANAPPREARRLDTLHRGASVDTLGFGRLAPRRPTEAQRSSLDADGSGASGRSEILGAERPPAP